MQALFTNNQSGGVSSGRHAQLRAAGDQHDGSLYLIQSGSDSQDGMSAQLEIPCSNTQGIEYKVSNAASRLTLAIVGADDEL